MWNDIVNTINMALGIGMEELTIAQMALRALIVFVITLTYVRLGDKRFIGENAAFDVILGIMLGSVMSRAITNASAFFPTIIAGMVLIVLHWLIAMLSFHSDWLGNYVKGIPRLLVKEGEIDWKEMRGGHVSHNDLMQSLRQKGLTSVDQVWEARLERSGDISVIKRSGEPRIIDVSVKEGVQTVRIQIDPN